MIITGNWVIIDSFSLTKSVGKFRVTNHVYRMTLINTTSIVPCPSLTNDMFLKLVNFGDVIDEAGLNENILVDIVGQVVNVGELKVYQVDNKDKQKVDLELRDISDARLSCTLWGVLADRILAACANNRPNMEINSALPEIVEFRENLPEDGLALTIKQAVPKEVQAVQRKTDFSRQFEKNTFAEIIEYNEEGKFRIFCSIYAIDTEFAWYYFVCLKCNTTVYKVSKVENEVVKKDRKTLFRCSTCNENITKVEPRFRLIVCVMDSTAQIKCVLFEKEAKMLIHKSSLQLLEGHLDEIQDPTNIPQGLKGLVGKSYQFVVTIAKNNIREESDVYKVAHAYVGLGPEEADSIEPSQGADDLSTIVSLDQETLMLTNSAEQIDALSTPTTTPSSKRKDDVSGDNSDHSSSTKKRCIGSIKGALEDADIACG
ncbi:PREDICTED: uncharacterized protein LOC104793829 [Camelina sativa]|uniref:Uncharacterized protein LOC104793829 n=1 Tax=Camelina sativa TaxID=90675 RepID=A0ABM0ZP90_CAMSA|nr:PREDICTED: uncharacterized protein LOC104793829 [Camelina sativa]